jgi:ubiquinone/menaquinone biosynthesis C-methylase UbiE
MKTKEKNSESNQALLQRIEQYWNDHIHDLEIAKNPVGSLEFFQDLEDYRFEKLHYLPRLVDFQAWNGKDLLEVGCGVGLDLARFARGGARVTGIDLADKSIELAKKHFAYQSLPAELQKGNGEKLHFPDNTFDVVYAHGVIQYTADAQAMINEMIRVLKPGGTAIMMVYNRLSWLNFLSRTLNVKMEHTDAPVLKKYSRKEFSGLLRNFSDVRIVTERFPVRSRLQRGLKAVFFNNFFVPGFNLIPKFITRRSGWHLMAFARKKDTR